MRNTVLAVCAILLLAAWTPFPTAVGPEVPLDAPPYVATGTNSPILASDGRGALLLSSTSVDTRVLPRGDTQHYVGLLDENGTPVGESAFLSWSDGGAVASSGRGYLVAFHEDGQMRAVRYTPEGRRLDATPIALGAADYPGEVAWDGTAYVVAAGRNAVSVGEDGRVLGARDITSFNRATQLAARHGVSVLVNQGSDFGPEGPIIAHVIGGMSDSIGAGTGTDIAAGDPGFLVVYRDGETIRGRVLDPSGRPEGSSFAIASAGNRPTAAWTGTEWLVAYDDSTSVRAVRVLRGVIGQPFLISPSGSSPALAAGGTTVFAAWEEQTGRREIHSATIEGEQVTITGLASRISRPQSRPVMTALDGATLVAWDDGATRVRRMDGASPTQTIAVAGEPAAFVAGEGSALLVLKGRGALNFVRVDRNGVPVSTHGYKWSEVIDHVAAAWVEDHWVVVMGWRITGGTSGLYRTTVTAEGAIGAPRRLSAPPSTPIHGLSVVAVGSKAVVFWAVDGTGGGRTMTSVIEEDAAWRPGRDLPARMFAAAGRGAEDVLTAGIRSGVAGDVLEWRRVLPDGSTAAQGAVPLPEAGMTVQSFFTGQNYLLLLTKTASGPNRIDFFGFRVDVSGAAIDTAPVRFASAFTTLPPLYAGATLRDETTLDFAYFRPLDDAGLFQQFPRVVFRSLHDAPRRRVVRE